MPHECSSNFPCASYLYERTAEARKICFNIFNVVGNFFLEAFVCWRYTSAHREYEACHAIEFDYSNLLVLLNNWWTFLLARLFSHCQPVLIAFGNLQINKARDGKAKLKYKKLSTSEVWLPEDSEGITLLKRIPKGTPPVILKHVKLVVNSRVTHSFWLELLLTLVGFGVKIVRMSWKHVGNFHRVNKYNML